MFKGAVPLETAALNRRRRSYAMYLFLVVCSMYAYFVVAVETDTNRQLLQTKFQEKRPTRNGETTVQTLRLFSEIKGRPLQLRSRFFFPAVA